MNQVTSKLSTQAVIVWAIDPTQKPTDAKLLVKELKTWAQHLNCSIQPVSIFSERVLNLPLDMAFPWKEKFKNAAQKSVEKFLKAANFKGALTPEILFTSTNSTTNKVIALVKYAEKTKALLIFANTRAQKTWNPFRLGGFAETLAGLSRTPILLFNSAAKPTKKISTILFATDFSRSSKVALESLVPWAKAFHAKIAIYSQVETPPIFPSEINGYWPDQLQIFEIMTKSDEKSRLKMAERWSNAVQSDGVDSQTIVQRQKKSLGLDIIAAAQKSNANLIALASHSNQLTQAVLGSVARDVLLQAKCPVLIFHRPKQMQKSRVLRPKGFGKQNDSRPSENSPLSTRPS